MGWAVRKAAGLLAPGERFVFSADLGGEGEVLTVVATMDTMGTTTIETEELDFDIEVLSKQWLTMAPDKRKRWSDGSNAFE
jgi:hypothetical protein